MSNFDFVLKFNHDISWQINFILIESHCDFFLIYLHCVPYVIFI